MKKDQLLKYLDRCLYTLIIIKHVYIEHDRSDTNKLLGDQTVDVRFPMVAL